MHGSESSIEILGCVRSSFSVILFCRGYGEHKMIVTQIAFATLVVEAAVQLLNVAGADMVVLFGSS